MLLLVAEPVLRTVPVLVPVVCCVLFVVCCLFLLRADDDIFRKVRVMV